MTIEEFRAIRNATPSSIDLTNEIGPISLGTQMFSLEGTDSTGHERDVALDGHSLGLDRLVFDQTSISLRIGIVDHLSIGIPFTMGGAPVSEPSYSNDPNAPSANGSAAMLLGVGVSPGYEINFGDSAFRFDAAVLGQLILVPTSWETRDKHGNPVAASAAAGRIAFEPRMTILPYVNRDLGLGFFGEADAIHPENWACGVVIQLRWGRAG
ncbi:MAG: hypothetical protein ACRELY_13835 [Polyangiaceae bacterium]